MNSPNDATNWELIDSIGGHAPPSIAIFSSASLTNNLDGAAGGTFFVSSLWSIGQLDLRLAKNTSGVSSQNNTGGNLNVTLSDRSQITFQNIASPLTNSNFA